MYWQAFPCCYTVSLLPGFETDGDPSRGVHASVWGRGAGLGSGRCVGRGSSGVVRGRELRLGSTCGSGWVTVTVHGLTPVTGPAVSFHSDNDKRMPGARPGLRRRSGVKGKLGARATQRSGRRSGGCAVQ